jgi:hypothetical protein
VNVVLLRTRETSGLTFGSEGLVSSIGLLLGLTLRGELVLLALLCRGNASCAEACSGPVFTSGSSNCNGIFEGASATLEVVFCSASGAKTPPWGFAFLRGSLLLAALFLGVKS